MSASKYLSGENMNYVLEQLYSALNQNGYDFDIKGNQGKVHSFMKKVAQQYPGEKIEKLNQYTLTTLFNMHRQDATPSRNASTIEDQFERMRSLRNYHGVNDVQSVPPTPDFTKPMIPGLEGNSNSSGGRFSLNQARGLASIATRPGRPTHRNDDDEVEAEVTADLSRSVGNRDRDSPPLPSQMNLGSAGSGREIWVSLSKSDLINQSDNSFTFSWDKSALTEQSGDRGVYLQLKYLTLPKYFPSLLVKYNSGGSGSGNDVSLKKHEDEIGKTSVGKVLSISKGGYGAKLVPHHSSGEYTTYQALGNSLPLKQLPNTFSIQLIPPYNGLDLNAIQVQKVTKQNREIHIITKYPHHLQSTDSLTLEFPSNRTCYKISNIRIIDDHQFMIDSPFVGCFNSNFKLLRNNWTLDLTLVCQPV